MRKISFFALILLAVSLKTNAQQNTGFGGPPKPAVSATARPPHISRHRRLRAGFLEIAKAEPARVVVLDADRPVAAVTADIRHAVDKVLARK